MREANLFGREKLYWDRGCRLRIVRKLDEKVSKPKVSLGSWKDQKDLWEALLGREVGEPYKGAVEDSSNALGKYLPEDLELDIEEIFRDIEEQ